MAKVCMVRKNAYFDSMFLMQVSRRLEGEPGVERAAVVLATENNKRLLSDLGFSAPEIQAAGPNDLVVALEAETEEVAQGVLGRLDAFLSRRQPEGEALPRTLDAALELLPEANLAVISLPGRYAAPEARAALERNLNVFLFSSGLSVEEELSLKELAHRKGLLLMGPDCGTAIIAGVGLGFANVVRRGRIGAIASSGTGLQEFTTLVHRAGEGISQAIGTGSRDLSDEIRGLSTLVALEVLERDPDTQVIVPISKPPGKKTLGKLLPRLERCEKPVVLCMLGIEPDRITTELPVVETMEEAAAQAVRLVGGSPESSFKDWEKPLAQERARFSRNQRYIRGIFAGGTFCYQAQLILQRQGIEAWSNAPLDPRFALPDPTTSKGHTLVDMGSEEFTEGRPHPMIDPTLRRERILKEAEDEEVAVLLLDFILGHSASPDPVGELLPAIREAKERVASRGGYLCVVASVCGTEEDPQRLSAQVSALERAGVVVLTSSAQAARFAAQLVEGK
jgi:FdrA protein